MPPACSDGMEVVVMGLACTTPVLASRKFPIVFGTNCFHEILFLFKRVDRLMSDDCSCDGLVG
jgi:hypothetical protein